MGEGGPSCGSKRVFFENTEDVWEAIGEDGSAQGSRITMLLLDSQHRLCRNAYASIQRERDK